MMQIQILDHVVFGDGSTNPVTAKILPDCVYIEYAELSTVVLWEEISNVDALSNLFADSTVRVFKVIVKLLGQVHANKEAYMMVLQP